MGATGKTTIPTVGPDATHEEARRAMRRAGADWALVVADGVVIGTVSANLLHHAHPSAGVTPSAEASLVWFNPPADAASRRAA